MKYISPLVASASGTLGGAVASKARGGINYFRSRIIPTNPSTLLQTAIRSAVQSASALWQSTLTELQQEGWFDIAEGAQTGKSLFAKLNQPRIYATNSTRVIDNTNTPAALIPTYFPDAPVGGGLTTAFSLPAAPVIDDSANTLAIGTCPGGPWNDEATGTLNSAVFVYLSGPQSPSRFSRQRPYQLIACYSVDDAGDFLITTPINLAAFGIPTVTGRVFYVKVYAQDSMGRTSLPQEFRVTVTA